MYEIRFHGRGGQGAVVASTVLAAAFFKEGKFVQAFPNFGAERRGAPVTAFTRVSDVEIRERFGIYAPEDYRFLGDYRVATLDANSIAREYGLGSASVPIVNTTILGAFSKATQTVLIDSIMAAVKEYAPSKPENNAKASLEAFQAVVF
jgi:pyruvate ferredoxin oxidoreductase gamma subunit